MRIEACNWNREDEESQFPERLRNLSITYSDAKQVEKRLEKLKSHDDNQTEHSICGGYWRGMSMQRYCTHCMQKVHKRYKYTVQRRDGVVAAVGVAMVVVVEGDPCMKEEESAAVELNKRGTVQ
jgi:histone acetyltransferase (RNA polymerase elongator complex component)